jgi:hypothetical protein
MTKLCVPTLCLLLASPALAQTNAAPPDTAFKRLPAFCLTASKSLDGTALSDEIDKVDESLDDSDSQSTCGLAETTLAKLFGLKDRLQRCATQAGASPLGQRLAEGARTVDGMIGHVRAAQSTRSCQSQ